MRMSGATIMKSIKLLCFALSLLLLSSCDVKYKKINELKSGKEVICRLIGRRVFIAELTSEEMETHVVTSARVITEHIIVYANRSCEWSFSYTDEEQVYVFEELLPVSVFETLQHSLKSDNRFKLKDGVLEFRYDYISNSSTMYSSKEKFVTEILAFLTGKYWRKK